MNWKVEYNADLQRMELTYKGLNSAKDIFSSSYATIQLSKEKGITRFYVDSRKLKLNTGKTELFELPSKLYEKWGLDPRSRIAILEPKDKDAKWKADFLYTCIPKSRLACKNVLNRKRCDGMVMGKVSLITFKSQ